MLDQAPRFVGYSDQDLVVRDHHRCPRSRRSPSGDRQAAERCRAAEERQPGALVAMTPDGAVRALVGGTRLRASQFNRATQALRQPGSAFKPFVYPRRRSKPACTPDDTVGRRADPIGNWRPSNYHDKYLRHGRPCATPSPARSTPWRCRLIRSSRACAGDRRRRSAWASLQPLATMRPHRAGRERGDVAGDDRRLCRAFANQGNGVWPYGIRRSSTPRRNVLYQRNGGGPGRCCVAGQRAKCWT